MTTLPYEIDEANSMDIQGSSLRGYLKNVNYSELERIFGKPTYNHNIHGEGDGKVRFEWDFRLNGSIITIYDWKEVAPRDEIIEWQIGGHDNAVVDLLDQFLSYLLTDYEVSHV